MSPKLSFYFKTTDPEFTVQTQTISSKPGNLVQYVFIRCPIYNKCNEQIGYKTSTYTLQQLGPNLYSVRISNTYYINGEGTINWEYSFLNSTPSVLYPINVLAESTIVSGTGEFLGAKGNVTLLPTPDGVRQVKIYFK